MESAAVYLNQIQQANKALEHNAREFENLENEKRALLDLISEAEWHIRESDENLCRSCSKRKTCPAGWAVACAYYAEVDCVEAK